MSSETIGVASAGVSLVSDTDYPTAANSLIQGSQRYCLATAFIVDIDAAEELSLTVDRLLYEMAAARWRGVDTRLVIGGSRDNQDIRDACIASRARAQALGVDARLVAASDQRSVHTKLLVADSVSLLGSHNWSPGAFGGQRQDSIAIDHAVLAAWFVSRFEEHWAVAQEEGFNVLG